MICHVSLAIAIFNLGLLLYMIQRGEKRRAAAEATDRALATILKRPPEPRHRTQPK